MYRSRVSLAMTEAAAIAALLASPSTTARWSWPVARTGKPSLKQMQPAHATFASASWSAARFVLWRPRASIPGAHRDTIATFVARRRITGNSSARTSGVCCLESLSSPSARTSPGPIASRSNSTAAATSGPARQPRPASSAPATNRTPSDRSNRNSRRAARSERLRRGGDAAPLVPAAAPFPADAPLERLEESDAVRRPVREERSADDPFARDWAPITTVLRIRAVVPHHEVVAGRNLDRFPEIARRNSAAGHGVGVLLLHAVADHMPIDNSDGVAGEADHALDERLARLLRSRRIARLSGQPALLSALVRVATHRIREVGAVRRVEHDDVAKAGIPGQAVGEDPLADIERRDHRRAGDAVRLDDERLDQERQRDRDRDREYQLDQALHRCAPVAGGREAATSGRSPYSCGEPLEKSDPVGRPVGQERLADDPCSRDRAPEPAVLGIGAVVAHHVVVARRNGDRLREVAGRVAVAGHDVAVGLPLPIPVDVTVDDRQEVAGKPDDALDERLRGRLLPLDRTRRRSVLAAGVLALVRIGAAGVVVLRRMEDDDVADVGRGEVHADPVDEDALVDPDGGEHRPAWDAVGLDQERLDPEREHERGDDDHRQLEQRAHRRLFRLRHSGCSPADASAAAGLASCGAVVGGSESSDSSALATSAPDSASASVPDSACASAAGSAWASGASATAASATAASTSAASMSACPS